MKSITRQNLALCMVAACSVVIATTMAPKASANQQIIGGQAHSDTVTGIPQPGFNATESGIGTAELGIYSTEPGIISSEPGIITTESGSYVGDIPAEQANPCSSGGCASQGACQGRGAGRLRLRSPVSDYASGQMIGRAYGRPDLFYNFYTQGYYNQTNAQMYLSPLPIPPNVGHTFFTYQPFYPHHMLYTHKNRFHRTYDHGRGMNRTHVSYRPSVRQVVGDFYWNVLRLPR